MSENKMELMATTLHNLIKDTPKKNSEKPHSGGGEDDRRRKEKGEKALLKRGHD